LFGKSKAVEKVYFCRGSNQFLLPVIELLVSVRVKFTEQ
jgi:hypothetical protein